MNGNYPRFTGYNSYVSTTGIKFHQNRWSNTGIKRKKTHKSKVLKSVKGK